MHFDIQQERWLAVRRYKRLWNKARAIFLGAMCEIARLGRQVFGIKWLSAGIRMSVTGSPENQPATDGLKMLAPNVDVQLCQNCLEVV